MPPQVLNHPRETPPPPSVAPQNTFIKHQQSHMNVPVDLNVHNGYLAQDDFMAFQGTSHPQSVPPPVPMQSHPTNAYSQQQQQVPIGMSIPSTMQMASSSSHPHHNSSIPIPPHYAHSHSSSPIPHPRDHIQPQVSMQIQMPQSITLQSQGHQIGGRHNTASPLLTKLENDLFFRRILLLLMIMNNQRIYYCFWTKHDNHDNDFLFIYL